MKTEIAYFLYNIILHVVDFRFSSSQLESRNRTSDVGGFRSVALINKISPLPEK